MTLSQPTSFEYFVQNVLGSVEPQLLGLLAFCAPCMLPLMKCATRNENIFFGNESISTLWLVCQSPYLLLTPSLRRPHLEQQEFIRDHMWKYIVLKATEVIQTLERKTPTSRHRQKISHFEFLTWLSLPTGWKCLPFIWIPVGNLTISICCKFFYLLSVGWWHFNQWNCDQAEQDRRGGGGRQEGHGGAPLRREVLRLWHQRWGT